MFGFPLDYYLCSVLAVSGVLFIVVAYQKSSLSPVQCCFGVIFMLVAGILFFSTDNRIVNDYQGGLDANEQAVLFALAALTAFIIRKLFSAGERVIRKNTN